jgi:hypothetical protein
VKRGKYANKKIKLSLCLVKHRDHKHVGGGGVGGRGTAAGNGPLYSRLGGPQSRSGHCKEVSSCFCQELNSDSLNFLSVAP